MATEDDILEIRKDFSQDMNNLRSEMRTEIKDTNKKIDGTNERIDSLYIASIAVWVSIFVAILAAIFGGPIFNKWLERREESNKKILRMRENALELAKENPEWAEAYKNIGLL